MKQLLSKWKYALLFALALSFASGAALAKPPRPTPPGDTACVIDPVNEWCLRYFSVEVCCRLYGL